MYDSAWTIPVFAHILYSSAISKTKIKYRKNYALKKEENTSWTGPIFLC